MNPLLSKMNIEKDFAAEVARHVVEAIENNEHLALKLAKVIVNEITTNENEDLIEDLSKAVVEEMEYNGLDEKLASVAVEGISSSDSLKTEIASIVVNEVEYSDDLSGIMCKIVRSDETPCRYPYKESNSKDT